MKYFNAYIIAKNPKEDCPFHPPPADNSLIRISYLPRQILAIGTFKSTQPIDVTSSTQVYDNVYKKYIQNNTQARKNYYTFEMQTQGSTTLDLMTNYIFNIWKGVHIWAVQFFYNDPRAYLLVPKPDKYPEDVVNTHCKKSTGNEGA